MQNIVTKVAKVISPFIDDVNAAVKKHCCKHNIIIQTR